MHNVSLNFLYLLWIRKKKCEIRRFIRQVSIKFSNVHRVGSSRKLAGGRSFLCKAEAIIIAFFLDFRQRKIRTPSNLLREIYDKPAISIPVLGDRPVFN